MAEALVKTRLMHDAVGHPVQDIFWVARSQKVAYTATAGRIGAALGEGVKAVRVTLSSAGYVALGNSGVTATANDSFLPASTPRLYQVRAATHVSAIQDSAGGTLYVDELE